MIGSLVVKTFRDHWKSLTAWGSVIVFMSSIQLYVYPTIVKTGDGMNQLLDSFPDPIKEIFRMQDYTSGAGFLSTELFSMMIPLVLIAVGATWGSSGTAQEEEDGTADLIFALPISRQRVILSKLFATVLACLILGVVSFVSISVGAPLVNMELDSVHLLAACISMFLLGVFFSSVGFLIGSLTGKKGVSLGISSGLGILAFLFYSLAPLVDTFDYITPINPIQWALGGNQLFEGPDYIGYAKLIAASLILFTLAIITFDRKDIRN